MTTLRIARPTDRLAELAAMYRTGLDLVELGRFEDHAGCWVVLQNAAWSA